MGHRIERLDGGLLAATFFGEVDIEERLGALGAVAEMVNGAGAGLVLVDLSEAHLHDYRPTDAVRLGDRVRSIWTPGGKIAYVMKPHQPDMGLMVLTSTYRQDCLRRFLHKEDAIAWLCSGADALDHPTAG